MEASELRIGNWVKCPHGDVQIERFIDLGVRFIDGSGGTFSSIDPIPLTSEWLGRFGFDVRDDNPKQKPHYEGDVLINIAGFEFTNSMKDGFYSYGVNDGNTILSYVHQLQNFYFAVKGKELELKEIEAS
ncbi:hypothetical protein [Adhaeribacter aquaticus]|uniref:hypothetical protein n=1 Tax=Adhaeribacter aquaticus TaxID=299567 RepID=UPI000420A39D|nr:hypothetical protein [Adhaeribacter aquaticus]